MAETIDEALCDEHLLGAALGDHRSWATWLAVLRASYGLPLDANQQQLFAAVAGDRAPPRQRVRELWATVGRRGGKSRMAAAIAVYASCFVKYPSLSPGEKGLVLLLAMSMEQARIVFNYCLAFLQSSDILRQQIESTTATEIRLTNGIAIATHANSFRSIRGRTLVCCVFDEVSFWRDDTTATPDKETYTAVLPMLLNTRGMLVGISSAYRRAGLLFAKHQEFYGVNDPTTLVVRGGTLHFNGTVDKDYLAAMRAADPVAAASEWDSEFRDDLTGLFDDTVIDRSVDRERPLELPPQDGILYHAHTDPSGGATSGDAYSLCFGHLENEHKIVDCVRGRTGPFNPKQVVAVYAALCKHYRIKLIHGDRYGKELNQGLWRDEGMEFIESKLWAWELYLEALVPFNQGLVHLPPNNPLINELKSLQRVANRTGRESVEHPRGSHDDLANAVCGCLYLLAPKKTYEAKICAPFVAMGPPRPYWGKI